MVKAKKGYLADGHISQSQLKVWLRSKKEYIKQYYYGEKFQGNKFTRLGNRVHDILEKGSEDEGENALKIVVDNYVAKFAVDVLNEVNVNHEVGKIKYQSIFDKVSWTDDFILEQKSGKETSWTQEIVDNDTQLHFYRMIYGMKTNKIPTIKLMHIITDAEQNITGKIKTYEFMPTEKQRKQFEKNLKDFFRWCDELTEDKIKDIMNVANEVPEEIALEIEEMQSTKEQIEALDLKLKASRVLVETYLANNKITKYEHNGTKLYFTEKKAYTYSPEINELKEKLDLMMDEFKKNNEPSSITKVFTVK